MLVRELIQKLQAMDPDAIVIASSDDEGNAYHAVEPFPSLLDQEEFSNTWTDGTKHRWLDFEPVSEEDIQAGEYGDKGPEDFVSGVCFYPTSIPAPGELGLDTITKS